jgi:histidinol-phosphate/aromatic aminotransferase/cobyric acid decarboxylase-like protein/choline kinase
MIACILAAGMGRRLKAMTEDRTKCMVELNGLPLIHYTLSSLARSGVQRFVIVVGYCKEGVVDYVQAQFPELDVCFVENTLYASTNNIYSLYLALPQLAESDGVIVAESDVWVGNDAVASFLASPGSEVVLASPFQYWMDGTCVVADSPQGRIRGFVSKQDVVNYPPETLYKTVNWYRFSEQFFSEVYARFITAYVQAFGTNSYYEDVLKLVSPALPAGFNVHVIHDDTWVEIDDEDDYRRALIVTAPRDDAARRLRDNFGGFWKYRYIQDLTLLVNPYFPPATMTRELGSLFDRLVREYPSRQSIICRLAAKTLDIASDHLAMGNGLSELLSVLARVLPGTFAVRSPYFLEYRRVFGDRLEELAPSGGDTYAAWSDGDAGLIVINPNNPSGELLPRDALLKLVSHARRSGRRVLVDESFLDFADPALTLVDPALLREYPNLLVLRSYGKTHGIPGLRLGLLACADTALVEQVRQTLPIWNVGSLAEAFLELLPRYRTEYLAALRKIAANRASFETLLAAAGFEVITTATNFVLFRMATDLAAAFETHCYAHGYLVKRIDNRPGLPGCHFRVAVRRERDNEDFAAVAAEFIRKRHA